MENLRPDQLLIPIAMAIAIGILCLIYDARHALLRAARAVMSRYLQPRPAPTNVRYLDDYTAFGSENEPAEPVRQAQNPQNLPRTSAFLLTAEECAAVARMIEHKAAAERPTKASVIWAGFGLKKGDSAKYKRASEIYDALFIIPPSVLFPDPEHGGRVPASYPVSGRRS